jgi:hypothetical protein
MNPVKLLACASVSLVCVACASSSSNSSSAQRESDVAADTQIVKSTDGSFTGEVVGKPVAGSKFGQLKIGMQMSEVQGIMGSAPNRWHTYESGKRWIPFYFGNDARRMQAVYEGGGCLIFTDGNVWGGAGGDLIQIENDPEGKCYQP